MLCATMYRCSLIILIIILYSCSTQQQPSEIKTENNIIKLSVKKPQFILQATTKCEQTKLSNQFDLVIDFRRYSDTMEFHDSCELRILIKDKRTATYVDSISLVSSFYYGDLFANCDNTTSYTTKFNSKRQVVDNYFGDIVVADLNFDNKDDVAVINDSGGNGGPLYSYFIQTGKKKFTLDNFLTDSVTYFPHSIDKTKHRLITYVHAGACCVGKHIYQLNKSMDKWKQTSHKILVLNSGT
jgi:hypothetical protein